MEISEHDFSTQVESLLEMFGWVWVHFRPARTLHGYRTPFSGKPGYPDYYAVREIHPDEFQRYHFELKSEKGKLTDDQKEWVRLTNAFVWRPSQLEEIAKILR
jgi:hypothetical protein